MVFVSIEIIVQPFFLDGIFTDHRKGGKMETASPKKNTRRIVEQLTRMSGACNRQISKQHRRDRHNATRSMYITLSFEKVSLPLADTPTPTPPAPRHTPTHEYTHEETSSRWPPYEKKQQNYNEPTKQSDFNSTFFSLFLYVAKRLLFKDKKGRIWVSISPTKRLTNLPIPSTVKTTLVHPNMTVSPCSRAPMSVFRNCTRRREYVEYPVSCLKVIFPTFALSQARERGSYWATYSLGDCALFSLSFIVTSSKESPVWTFLVSERKSAITGLDLVVPRTTDWKQKRQLLCFHLFLAISN